MTTEPIAPRFNLSLKVLSGPEGKLKDGWQCIEYRVALLLGERDVYEFEYYMGIGAVDLKKTPVEALIPREHVVMLRSWRRHPQANFKGKLEQAQAAAWLAKKQGILPEVDDVVHSLLLDGSAFFDAESFESWAENFGVDTDSRKAEKLYQGCFEMGRTLTAHLGQDTIVAMREAWQDY